MIVQMYEPSVQLVSYTVPTAVFVEKGIRTAEQLIAYHARVSNPSNQLNTATAYRLLAYCYKHKHFSIFEMVNVSFEVKATRAVTAQLLRHKSFCHQEYSQRYATQTNISQCNLRERHPTNRQLSVHTDNPALNTLTKEFIEHHNKTLQLYSKAIANGVAPETARDILPMSSESVIHINGNVRSWIHYFLVRLDESTQLEHRMVAQALFKEFSKVFPTISELIKAGNLDG